MNCTLKVNMILGDGKHYSRGSVVDKALIPEFLQTRNHIEIGRVHIARVMPIDQIELKDDEQTEEQTFSPMHEPSLSELDTGLDDELEEEEAELEAKAEPEPIPSKVVRRRLKRKT